MPFFIKIDNLIDKANRTNTNFIYFICVLLVFIVNIFLNVHVGFSNWIEISGTIIQIAIPAYALVPVVWKKDKNGAIQMIKLLCIVLVVTYILKFTIPEKRPYGGSMSFPSGHTTGAFSGAMYLGLRYGLRYFIISTPLALFVAFSRIYSRNHWPMDVIASIILCVIVALFIVKSWEKES